MAMDSIDGPIGADAVSASLVAATEGSASGTVESEPTSRPLSECLANAIATIDRLVAVLERETQAVSSMDLTAATVLQEEKVALTDAYAARMKELGGHRDELTAAGDAATGPLAEAHARLTASLRRNLRALENGRRAAERVVETIGAAVRQTAAQGQGYSRRGTPSAPPGGRCIPVSLDGKV